MNLLNQIKKLTLMIMIFTMTFGATYTTYGAPQSSELEYAGRFKLTAYCPCRSCSGKWGTQTASGKKAREDRTIAVDTKEIKLGTKVSIDGNIYTAEDVGGGVKGNHIDIFFSNHSKVEKFGMKSNQKVYIVKK